MGFSGGVWHHQKGEARARRNKVPLPGSAEAKGRGEKGRSTSETSEWEAAV